MKTPENNWINIRQAAVVANMEYETFRYWVRQKRGPKKYHILDRVAFDLEEVKKWRPVYKKRGGDQRSKKKS